MWSCCLFEPRCFGCYEHACLLARATCILENVSARMNINVDTVAARQADGRFSLSYAESGAFARSHNRKILSLLLLLCMPLAVASCSKSAGENIKRGQSKMFTIDGCTVDIRLDTARGVEIGLPGPTILVTNFSNRTKFFKFAFFSAVHEDGSFNRFLLINDSGYRVWPKSDGTLEIIGEQETAIKTGSKAYFLGDSQGRGWLRVEAGRTAEKRFPRERSTSADVPIRIWYIQSSTSDLLLKDYAFGAVEGSPCSQW